MTQETLNLKPLLPLLPVALVGLLVLWHPFIYVTEPGNATVVFNAFGGLQKGRVESPGISFINPGVDRPIPYNVRTRVWQFTEEEVANKAGGAIAVNTADGQAFAVDVFLALKPNVAVLDTLHGQIGENYMTTVVVPAVRSKFRDISSGFDSQDFYQKEKRSAIESQAVALINRELPTVVVDGKKVPLILIEGLYLGTPAFPPGLKDSLERKQVASITAQTASVKAQIQAKETQRLLILAGANQTAIELQGKAAAKNAQLADLLFYERLEDRIGKARDQGQPSPLKVIRVEGNSTVFLNVDPRQAAAATPAP